MKKKLLGLGAICMIASTLLTSCLVQDGRRHHRGPRGPHGYDHGHYYNHY